MKMRERIHSILKVIHECFMCEMQCPLYEACEQCGTDICTMLRELDNKLINKGESI